METIFINTENSKTNEFNKFIYHFADKRDLKYPNNKNVGLVNLSIYCTWKGIKLTYKTTINLKYLPQLGMMNLISLRDHIQSQKFKITLKLSFKSTKL